MVNWAGLEGVNMIRAIDYQKVEMSDEEYAYYEELVKKFTDDKHKGTDYFANLFITDAEGIISLIKPAKPVPWEILFFTLNLQQNQHLRENDRRITELEERMKGISGRVAKIGTFTDTY